MENGSLKRCSFSLPKHQVMCAISVIWMPNPNLHLFCLHLLPPACCPGLLSGPQTHSRAFAQLVPACTQWPEAFPPGHSYYQVGLLVNATSSGKPSLITDPTGSAVSFRPRCSHLDLFPPCLTFPSFVEWELVRGQDVKVKAF